MQIKVKGGTNAGWRHVSGPIARWVCPTCKNPSRYNRCLHDGTAKPKE